MNRPRRILRVALSTLLLALFAASASCAAGHVRSGDKLAKAGKYEEALVEYKEAQKIQATNRVLKRISKVEKVLAEKWVKKGLEAAKANNMVEAADLWASAAEIRPNDTKPGSPRVVIAENATKLELCGEAAMREKKWEDAFHCWETLRIAYPDRLDLQTRIDDAKRAFAGDLDRDAQALAKKGLTGAALVLAMRARTYDPLQDGGFSREQKYRSELAGAALVNIANVAIEDRGHWAIGGYLAPAIERRLNSHPPYGPTRNAGAAQATFAATVEQFGWWDEPVHGYTRKEIEGGKAASREKQPSPERAAQKTTVEKLEKELKQMEAAAKAGAAAPAAVSTPAPAEKEKEKEKGGKGAKAAATPAPAPAAKRSLAARAPSADDIAKKRKELDAALAKLQAMPELVDPAIAASEYYLVWTEVTRVVEATVRFEVREPDFAEPVTKTVTLRVTSKDRTNPADEAHKVAADPLELRTVEELVKELAKDLADPGTDMLAQARERRAERWITKGRDAHAKGQQDESLDCYVRALFAKGVEGGSLPGDAATHVAIRLEQGSFRDIVAGP